MQQVPTKPLANADIWFFDPGTYLRPSPAASSTEGGLEPARTSGKASMYTLCGAVWRLELCGVRCEIAPKCCSRRICEPCSQLGFFIVLWELAARNENLGANLSVQMDSYAYDESICTLKLAPRFLFSCSRFPQNPLQTPTYVLGP